MPELISRQLAGWITDKQGFSVLESTVYRILLRAGLVKRPEMRLAAGKEYHRKPTGPHQMWATDASYFRVVGWDYYSMVTVMDDYFRFILAHKLQRDMTADFFIEVVQEAVDRAGMDRVPVTDRTRLLSDNGPRLCLKSLQRLPGDGRHQAHPGNPRPPSDVLRGRRQEILQRRKEVQARTNRTVMALQQGPQRAQQPSIQHLISRLPECPTFAGCQQLSTNPTLLEWTQIDSPRVPDVSVSIESVE